MRFVRLAALVAAAASLLAAAVDVALACGLNIAIVAGQACTQGAGARSWPARLALAGSVDALVIAAAGLLALPLLLAAGPMLGAVLARRRLLRSSAAILAMGLLAAAGLLVIVRQRDVPALPNPQWGMLHGHEEFLAAASAAVLACAAACVVSAVLERRWPMLVGWAACIVATVVMHGSSYAEPLASMGELPLGYFIAQKIAVVAAITAAVLAARDDTLRDLAALAVTAWLAAMVLHESAGLMMLWDDLCICVPEPVDARVAARVAAAAAACGLLVATGAFVARGARTRRRR